MENVTFDDFLKIHIICGTIIGAKLNSKAKKPAYILEIDFGNFGIKTSSAQITQNYTTEELVGQQILAVMNFATKKVAGINSEVLVLATVCDKSGTVLIQPKQTVNNGTRVY